MDNLYNSKNPLVRFVFNNKLKTINKIIEKENGVTVLDAGCGEGQTARGYFPLGRRYPHGGSRCPHLRQRVYGAPP